jgi:hypothetical protein
MEVPMLIRSASVPFRFVRELPVPLLAVARQLDENIALGSIQNARSAVAETMRLHEMPIVLEHLHSSDRGPLEDQTPALRS